MHHGGHEDGQVLGVRNSCVLGNDLWRGIGHNLQGACCQRIEEAQRLGQLVLKVSLCLDDNLRGTMA